MWKKSFRTCLRKCSDILLKGPNQGRKTSLNKFGAVSETLTIHTHRKAVTDTRRHVCWLITAQCNSFSLQAIRKVQHRFISCTDMSATGASLFLAGFGVSNCDGWQRNGSPCNRHRIALRAYLLSMSVEIVCQTSLPVASHLMKRWARTLAAVLSKKRRWGSNYSPQKEHLRCSAFVCAFVQQWETAVQ